MDKLRMESKEVSQENIERIRELFPNCVTEILDNGNLRYAIDFDVLKQELSSEIVEGNEERYQFTWPDKRKAINLANTPTTSTLRPCREESVDFDNTKNLYIEGDNLEVLKCLRETYLGKIKMIYIDPPYNTGTNVIYKNDFSISKANYIEKSGLYNENGERLMKNTESNGRFHTDWLNMIYPVIKISKDLLCNEGYICIAIDDNELYNLKKIIDEIYGEDNYIGTIVTRCNPQGRGKYDIDPVHEYHLIYSKSFIDKPRFKIKRNNGEQQEITYKNLMRTGSNSRKYERPYRFYPMLVKGEKVYVIPKDEYKEIYIEGKFNEAYILELKEKYERLGYEYILPISRDGEFKVWQRKYDRVCGECETYKFINGQIKTPDAEDKTPMSLWYDDIHSNVSYGTNYLKSLFDGECLFDYSKSVYTVKDLIYFNTSNDDIIMDFFPGSATTAQSTMKLNQEDCNNRKFIMIQLPESTAKDSNAYKAGYKNICEIGKERIRRAGKKIKEEPDSENIDTGFRVLKLASSNMEEVYYTPKELQKRDLFSLIDNVKPDRTSEDLLFQVMLECNVTLDAKIEKKEINGKEVFYVNDGYLVACFDKDIDEDIITEIAKQNPVYFVIKGSQIENDCLIDNFDQLFKNYSPDTIRRML